MWFEPWLLVSISQFLLIMLGVITKGRYEEWAKKRQVLVLILFLILGALGFVGTIAQAVKSAREVATSRAILENVHASAKEIERLQILNTDLQRQLLASSETIRLLAKQNINTVTGGDSFCYGSISPNTEIVFFAHQGKYPMANVVARIVDVTYLKFLQGKPSEERLPGDEQRILMGITILIGELIPGSSVARPAAFPFRHPSRQDFNIFFTGRNGFWQQLIRWRKVEDNWIFATKVMGHGKKQPLYEWVDKDFPRNAQGNIEWDN